MEDYFPLGLWQLDGKSPRVYPTSVCSPTLFSDGAMFGTAAVVCEIPMEHGNLDHFVEHVESMFDVKYHFGPIHFAQRVTCDAHRVSYSMAAVMKK